MRTQDLTHYRNQELSDQFMNDEYLYDIITSGDWNIVKEMAEDCFTFTSAQLNELQETFNELVE